MNCRKRQRVLTTEGFASDILCYSITFEISITFERIGLFAKKFSGLLRYGGGPYFVRALSRNENTGPYQGPNQYDALFIIQ